MLAINAITSARIADNWLNWVSIQPYYTLAETEWYTYNCGRKCIRPHAESTARVFWRCFLRSPRAARICPTARDLQRLNDDIITFPARNPQAPAGSVSFSISAIISFWPVRDASAITNNPKWTLCERRRRYINTAIRQIEISVLFFWHLCACFVSRG